MYGMLQHCAIHIENGKHAQQRLSQVVLYGLSFAAFVVFGTFMLEAAHILHACQHS